MNILAMRAEKARLRKEKQESDYRALLARAVKAAGLSGAPTSPAGELALLRRYIAGLDSALVELAREFGKDGDSAGVRLRVEREQAINRIAKIMAAGARPQGL